ncbi:MAG: NAD(P)-dependent oxidoreductase [Planctomycetota bacterium]
MRIVLTGAAGQIGQKLCGTLAESGGDVLALDRRFDPALAKIAGVEHRVIDLLDPVSIYPVLQSADALIHFGNLPNVYAAPPPQVYRDNVQMNQNAFLAAAEVGVQRILFASSVQVIAGNRTIGDASRRPSCLPELPITGKTPANPANLYALSKLAGEDLLRMLTRQNPELSAVSLRLPFTCSGPRMPNPIDLDDARQMRWRKHNYVDEGFAWLDVAELGPLVRGVLRHAGPGYDCLLPASDDSQIDWPAERIVERFFADLPVRGSLAGRFTLVDNSPITDAYGWRPTDLREHRAPFPAAAPA